MHEYDKHRFVLHEPSINDIKDMIIDNISYIDTVWFWLTRNLRVYERDTIDTLCGSFSLHVEDMKYHKKWRCRVVINQPCPEVFLFLEELSDLEYMINHLAIALDFITDNSSDADDVKLFFDMYMVKRWHTKQFVNNFEGTSYTSAKRWVANNIVKYSDRTSKIKGKYCCHIEWRLSEAATIRKYSFDKFNDLLTIDHYLFWKSRLLLKLPIIVNLGIKLMGRSLNRKKPYIKHYGRGIYINMYRRAGLIAMALCRKRLDHFSSQEIIDNAKFSIKGCFVELPNEYFLPNN